MKTKFSLPKLLNPVLYSRAHAEVASGYRLKKLHQSVLLELERDFAKDRPLVAGVAVPTDWLQPLLEVNLNHSSKALVIFLDGEMAHAIWRLGIEPYQYTLGWNLSMQGANLYFTWDLPKLNLNLPNFRSDLKSKLAFVSPSIYRGMDFFKEEDAPDSVLNILFVTDENVFVSPYVIDIDDDANMQVLDRSANDARGYQCFTESQLNVAETIALEVGTRWPWSEGTWPVVYEREENYSWLNNPRHQDQACAFTDIAPCGMCFPLLDGVHPVDYESKDEYQQASANFIGGHLYSVESLSAWPAS